MTSLTRSALASVAMLPGPGDAIGRSEYPSSAKMTTMTASRDPINFALML
jgi:hypothetical protein